MKREKSYIIELDFENGGFKDAITVSNKTPNGRKLLRDLADEGINMDVVETTGIHEITPKDGAGGERLRVKRIA